MQPDQSSDYAAAFAPALLDPDAPVPAAVTGPRGATAVRRYNVYRNNVTVSLINALAAIYPAVQRLTGADLFRAMARSHVRQTPPASPLLFDYGRDFPAFIAGYPHAQDLPWLVDVARIERAWLDAYHAADADPLAPAALASVAPDRLGAIVFAAHPATCLVRSRFAAVSIFVANRTAEAARPIDGAIPEDALVTRPEADVTVRRLPPGGALFLAQLLAGATLADAAAAALADSPDFDLATNIAGLIEAGAFTSLTSGDAP